MPKWRNWDRPKQKLMWPMIGELGYSGVPIDQLHCGPDYEILYWRYAGRELESLLDAVDEGNPMSEYIWSAHTRYYRSDVNLYMSRTPAEQAERWGRIYSRTPFPPGPIERPTNA